MDEDTDWAWVEPPNMKKSQGKRGQLQKFVAALKERPGEWAQYRPGHPLSSASMSYMKQRYGLEATSRRRPDHKFDIYARWVERKGSDQVPPFEVEGEERHRDNTPGGQDG